MELLVPILIQFVHTTMRHTIYHGFNVSDEREGRRDHSQSGKEHQDQKLSKLLF